jgi:hypothetical protein
MSMIMSMWIITMVVILSVCQSCGDQVNHFGILVDIRSFYLGAIFELRNHSWREKWKTTTAVGD